MSAYISRWCLKHGEWDDDVDHPSECPDCLSEGTAPSQIKDAEIARLRAELDAWKARMKALTGSDQPDAAGNAVISLRAELDEETQRSARQAGLIRDLTTCLENRNAELKSAREAIMMLAPADEEDHWFNLANFDLDLWFRSPAVQAACEGKR